MHWVKKILGAAVLVGLGLVVLNFVTKSFAPGVRGYLGLA